ncbi:hypothetical protein [Paenibacillus sp. LHD-38]|uniref:hypothetical protein n=1 Tax=Paenibacillus sp. LHD-38 TaxID=3072143 RepID=UPI0028108753|nr:hypothetical protein [Paenibacillus sp. LHD-38]MDQ8733037.1 hypothetical protein [Paenibacillus sp. LHD-38]
MIDQTNDTETIGEIFKNSIVNQTFVSEQNNINGISIKLATFTRVNKGHIIIGLEDSNSGRTIYESKVNTESISDNDYYKIRFPPIKNSNGKKYNIYIKSLDGIPNNAITLYTSKNDVYSKGSFYINGVMKNVDATFQVVYNKSIFNYLLDFKSFL